MQSTQKHIHFIGICGVAMSALAIAFQKNGWKVTGSDKGFYPPVSTHLREAGVEYYPGWHVDKMTANGNPDLVVVGNVAGSSNPELNYVLEHKIPSKSYPEIIAEFFCADDNLVCAGTYGKTTTAALLSWIFTREGTEFDNVNYMFGGLTSHAFPSAHTNYGNRSNAQLAIFEGDEYKASRTDNRAKFFYYNPTFILLTAVEWDHADIYKTKEDYLDAFRKLVQLPSQDGLIVACSDNQNIKDIIEHTNAHVITYGQNSDTDYQYSDVVQTKKGLNFKIEHAGEIYEVDSPLIGIYMAENITGAFAMAHMLGVKAKDILMAISSFKGLKRRLEKRYDGTATVFDDIAHSPAKATSVLKNLRAIYDKKIIAVYEPNTGNRMPSVAHTYEQAFADADLVFVPRLSVVKKDPNAREHPIDGAKLADIIAEQNSTTDVLYCPNDQDLVDSILDLAQDGDVVVFLGSHGFRGMIEEICTKLKQKE